MAGSARIESATVLRMFPSLVWQTKLSAEICRSLNPRIALRLEALRGTRLEMARGESWQSPTVLQREEALGPLIAAIDKVAAGVLESLHIGSGSLSVTGCWANVNGPGTAHGMHAHPNNFLSGVYYLSVPPGADTLNFHDPRPQKAVICPPVTELSAENTDRVVLRVEEGTLLLFPSWLMHSVDANAGTQTRLSLSFNLMFEGFAERLAPPMWGER